MPPSAVNAYKDCPIPFPGDHGQGRTVGGAKPRLTTAAHNSRGELAETLVAGCLPQYEPASLTSCAAYKSQVTGQSRVNPLPALPCG